MKKFERHGVIIKVREESDNAPLPLAVVDVVFADDGNGPDSGAVARSTDQLREMGSMFSYVADLIDSDRGLYEEVHKDFEPPEGGDEVEIEPTKMPTIQPVDEDEEWPKTWNEVRGIEGGDIVSARDSWDEFGSAMRVYEDTIYVRAGAGYEGGSVRNAWLPLDVYLRRVRLPQGN